MSADALISIAVLRSFILARQFEPEAPNQAWAADITYVWTGQGWLYLAVVMDLFSRRIVGFSMGRDRAALFHFVFCKKSEINGP